jgi:hypothetical protein
MPQCNIANPADNDITIYWRDKPKYNRHKVAIEIQDACNLRAIAREFVKVVESASDETQSTTETCNDPAVVLLVNKLESLCRSEARFSAAYRLCSELAAKKS